MPRTRRIPGPIDDKAVSAAYINDKSCLLDGVDERVEMGDVSALSFERTDPFSLTSWFKSSASAAMVLLAKRDASGSRIGYSLLFVSSLDKFKMDLVNDDSTNKISVDFVTGVGEFNNGVWHHAAMTYSGSSTAAGVKVYINGVSKTPTVVQDNLSASILTTAIFCLGSRDGLDRFFNGNLDEPVVYDKELSSLEVNDLYNSGTPRDPKFLSTRNNIVGFWRMGDGDIFPNLEDNSANKNDGKMINMEAGDIVTDTPP